jgi:hypothetical protein
MAAGLYSMRSAILRIETFWKPFGHEQLARGVENRARAPLRGRVPVVL